MDKNRIEELRRELQAEINNLKKQVSPDNKNNSITGLNEVVIGGALLCGLFSVQSFVLNVTTPMQIILVERSSKDNGTQNVL